MAGSDFKSKHRGNTFKVSFLALILLMVVEGRELHVSASAKQGGKGTLGSPFRTIQAAADLSSPGDVVLVREGVYEERVTVSRSGRPGAPVSYHNVGGAVVRGFLIRADHVRVSGFEITHERDVGYSGINIQNTNYVEILHCHIHNTSVHSVHPVGSRHLVFRGNRFSYSGSPGNNSGPGAKSVGDWGDPNRYVIFEYNHFSHTTDYICSNGDHYLVRNNVLGPTVDGEFGSSPHVDGWQANLQTRYGIMESNWHVDNGNSDSHMILIESPVEGESGHFAVVKNVSLRSGSPLWFQMRDADHLHAAHNSVGQAGYGPKGPGWATFFYVWEQKTPSLKNVSMNNIFYKVTKKDIHTVKPGNELYHGFNHVDIGGDVKAGVNGNIKSDPSRVSWEDYANDVLTLKEGAPDIGAAGALTTVSGAAGSGKSFTVKNPDWFHDGYGLTRGHQVYVGHRNGVFIEKVDHTLKRITVADTITWKEGDPVGYAFRGAGPDLGAYEFGDRLLRSAEVEYAGDRLSVKADGDVRFVTFSKSGKLLHHDDEEPFYFKTKEKGLVVHLYARHAQPRPVIELKWD